MKIITITRIKKWKPLGALKRRVEIALNLFALIFLIVFGSFFGYATYNGLPPDYPILPNKAYWIYGLSTGILATTAFWIIFTWLYEPCKNLIHKWFSRIR